METVSREPRLGATDRRLLSPLPVLWGGCGSRSCGLRRRLYAIGASAALKTEIPATYAVGRSCVGLRPWWEELRGTIRGSLCGEQRSGFG